MPSAIGLFEWYGGDLAAVPLSHLSHATASTTFNPKNVLVMSNSRTIAFYTSLLQVVTRVIRMIGMMIRVRTKQG